MAQDRFEVFGAYSYLRFSPTITGVGARSFNGGGGGAQLNFLKIFGIKGEFMGYGSTTFTGTFRERPTPRTATCSPICSDPWFAFRFGR